MITLPDFSKAWDYENNFYLSCDNTRFSKFVAHYELFKMIKDLPGDMIECGIFKGASFVRFAAFRDIFESSSSRKLIGFDTFGKFPEAKFEKDKKYRDNLVKIENGGDQSISKEQLLEVLKNKGVDKNIELVEGNVIKTVPEYLKKNPHLKIALLNLDTDIYEPAVTILEHMWPRIVKGGVLILDDYANFPGETKADDDYFKDKNVFIKKFPFVKSPCYIIKNEF